MQPNADSVILDTEMKKGRALEARRYSFRSTMTEILDKTKEWSDRFGGTLRASAQTQYPHLYKGAVGGIEHVISVDNGGYYMELWRGGENKDNYYATTGAAIKPLPGLAKGARLDEALDRFFTLMAKVEKDYPPTASGKGGVVEIGGAWRDKPRGPRQAESGMRLPAKKAIPKKAKRLLHLHRDKEGSTAHHKDKKPKTWVDYRGQTRQPAVDTARTPEMTEFLRRESGAGQPGYGWPSGGRVPKKALPKKVKRLLNLNGPSSDRPRPIKKRVMEKVDPEIGPSQSVGHRKPSDLSPESGVSKLARRMIRNLVGEPYNQMQKGDLAGERVGTPKPEVNPWRREPGGGTGRGSNWPPKKPVKKNVVALTAPGGVANQPGSGRVKPGTPPKTYQSPQGFSGRRMGGPGSKSPAAGTSGAGVKQYQDSAKRKARKGETLGQKTTQRRAPYVGSRPAGASSPLLRRRKIDDITGGRVGEGGKITPVKPATGGPGQPTGYGSTGMPQYSYGRKAAKGCGCGPAAEVRKAVRAVYKHGGPGIPAHDANKPHGGHGAVPKPHNGKVKGAGVARKPSDFGTPAKAPGSPR